MNLVPLAPGTPAGVAVETVVLPFNDAQTIGAILDEHKDDIACVLVDPLPHRIGILPVSREYLCTLRDWASANWAMLTFDEVMTFRNGFAGMQSDLGFLPDLTALGKIIGDRFPVSALAGREAVMEFFVHGDGGMRLPITGTFSANPVTMTAGYVAMSLFDETSIHRLNGLGDLARKNLAEAAALADVLACVSGAGSLLRFHFSSLVPGSYRDAYATQQQRKALSAFISAMYAQGHHADPHRHCGVVHPDGCQTYRPAMRCGAGSFQIDKAVDGTAGIDRINGPERTGVFSLAWVVL